MENEEKIKSLSFEMKSIIMKHSKYENIRFNYYDGKNISYYSSVKEGKIKVSEEDEQLAIFNIFPFIYNNELNFLISLNGNTCDAFVYTCDPNKYNIEDVSSISYNMITILKECKNGYILINGQKFVSYYRELHVTITSIIDDYNYNTRKFIDYTNIINEERKLKEEIV